MSGQYGWQECKELQAFCGGKDELGHFSCRVVVVVVAIFSTEIRRDSICTLKAYGQSISWRVGRGGETRDYHGLNHLSPEVWHVDDVTSYLSLEASILR